MNRESPRTSLFFGTGFCLLVCALLSYPGMQSIGEQDWKSLAGSIGNSLLLLSSALFLTLCFSLPLAVGLTRWLPRRFFHPVTRWHRWALSVPIQIIAVILLVGSLAFFPVPVLGEKSLSIPGNLRLLDRLWHLILPAMTLALPASLLVSLQMCQGIESARRTGLHWPARAQGKTESDLFFQSILPHAFTRLRSQLHLVPNYLVSGLIVVEPLCLRNGIGTRLVEALQTQAFGRIFTGLASLWVISLILTSTLDRLFPPTLKSIKESLPVPPPRGRRISSRHLAWIALIVAIGLLGSQGLLWLSQDLALSPGTQLFIAGADLFAWALGTTLLMTLAAFCFHTLGRFIPAARRRPIHLIFRRIPPPPIIILVIVLSLRLGGNALHLMAACALLLGGRIAFQLSGPRVHHLDPSSNYPTEEQQQQPSGGRHHWIRLARAALAYLPLVTSVEISAHFLGLTTAPIVPNLGRILHHSWIEVVHGNGMVFSALTLGLAVIVLLKGVSTALDRALSQQSDSPHPETLPIL